MLMMRMKNRIRTMFTFIMLAFPGFGQPPQVWSRLTQPPYPYLYNQMINVTKLSGNNCCTPFFEIRPVLGQDVIVDVQLFLLHPSALPMASDVELEVVEEVAVVLFCNLMSSTITNYKQQTPRYCTDNWFFAGTNKVLEALSCWLCNNSSKCW